MCLVAQQIVHTSGQWQVQLKECGEHDFEFWNYNEYVCAFIESPPSWSSYFQRGIFVHRQSGLCLDEPLEPISDNPTAIRIPTVRTCERSRIEQKWDIIQVEWMSNKTDRAV